MVRAMTKQTPGPSATGRSTLRLRPERPPDVLDLVPILLGFHPEESLVVVVLHGSSVVLTARIDLGTRDELEGDGPAGQGGRAAWLGARMAEIAVQHDATGVILVGYSEDAGLAAFAVHRAVLAQPAGIEVVDAICADRRRWWSLTCPCPSCAAEGTPYEAGGGELAAEAVYAGVPLRVFGDRREKEATVRPPPADELAALRRVTATTVEEWAGRPTAEQRAALVAAVQAFTAGAELTDAECARFAVLASVIEVRDAVWVQFTRPDSERMCDLWGQVVRRTVAPFEPAPLCLLGLAAWLAGDGALQVMCFERALAVEPGHTLARLLEQLNDRAVPPSLWDEMAEEVRALSGAEH